MTTPPQDSSPFSPKWPSENISMQSKTSSPWDRYSPHYDTCLTSPYPHIHTDYISSMPVYSYEDFPDFYWGGGIWHRDYSFALLYACSFILGSIDYSIRLPSRSFFYGSSSYRDGMLCLLCGVICPLRHRRLFCINPVLLITGVRSVDWLPYHSYHGRNFSWLLIISYH